MIGNDASLAGGRRPGVVDRSELGRHASLVRQHGRSWRVRCRDILCSISNEVIEEPGGPMTDGGGLRLVVTLDMPGDFEAIEVEQQMASLGRALADLGGLSLVTPLSPADGRDGAKGLPEILGVIALTISSSPQLLTTALDTIRAWLPNSISRAVVVEIAGDRLEITGATVAETRQLVELFVRRHAGQVTDGS
ncbi:hypothetical protein [Micromonospora sp. NPDC049301]|uniref:hypothetical protein n=1 Tax=Micromonospora sp. NPDC049301 TaxID=3155723 RepID=UPI00344129F8